MPDRTVTAAIVPDDRTVTAPATAPNDQTVTAAAGGDPPPGLPEVPGFTLLAEVGRGGMGVVYRARDLALDREVAVKVLLGDCGPDSPSARRFLGEARATARLQHPGIPAVYQAGRLDDGRPYLAMKLILGQALDAMLKAKAPLDPPAVVEAVAQAVGYAHAQGVIHRDLKPANIMVGAFGEVQVMDWGLARTLASGERERPEPPVAHAPRSPTSDFTEYGSILGTPAYMAPEQAAGELDRLGPPADVFGLGAVLCAALTGRPPFDGENTRAVVANAAAGNTAAAFARLDVSGADPAVVLVCKRCLAFDPADRPADGAAVAAELAAVRQAAEERVRAAERERLAFEVRAGEQAKRRRVTRWAAAAVAVVLLAGTGVSVWQAGVARKEAADAVTARGQAEEKRAAAEAAERGEATQRAAAEAQKVIADRRRVDAEAMLTFFEDSVFAAARTADQPGGLGKDVTLRQAITAALPALAAGFKDSPAVEASLRDTLARTFWSLGDVRAAGEQWQRAGVLFEQLYGPFDRRTLEAAYGTAICLNALGKPADSLKMFEKLLALQREHLPADDPFTLRTRLATAEPLEALGRGPEALQVREDVLADCRKSLPVDHPQLLLCLGNLANSYGRAGRAKDALDTNVELLAAYERTRPKDHTDVIRTTLNLALCHTLAGDPDEAVRLGERAAAAAERVLPPDHPGYLRCLSGLGNVYTAAGRPADALKAQQKAVTAYAKAVPPDHAEALAARYNLANCLLAVNKPDDALKEHQAVLAARRKALPRTHPEMLQSLASVANGLARGVRPADAVPFADECVAGAANNPAADPRLVVDMVALRFAVFLEAKHAKGCRETAERWEGLKRADGFSLFLAARYRADTAGVEKDAKLSAADADRAMDWLAKAVAAGFKDRKQVETDEGLDPLRGRADFKKLLDAMPNGPPDSM